MVAASAAGGMAASCTEGGLPKGKSGDVHQLKLRRRHSCTQSVAQPKPVLIYPDYRLPFKLTTDARRPVGTTQQHADEEACINVLLDEDGEGQTLSWATARGFRNLAPTPSSLNAADDYFECAPVVM
ncbi:hypothetical protein GN244_ATG19346 [Phytophthora infestans]|uniref:Uncharacterized protein n=1 Tax=Phytophthora infestans TaxID=4787 RepID=A0A833VUA0_PHYIN|nr:hypothetical protein GN244_ATG19346 [Phytophthora infestans]